ncbi:ribonuclease H-like domain-containing protein [Lasiosphaeris hirsuta]|uniref:Ribonuclease H-like domain-containing protein n=1 Tax=Lasiosphaeris hirsuta TaxID=260670 RepID=A0AA39ZXR1_9PEZI|nr:ribonuclease H-like domain-containing protein [Lasiosphaeris hirsuta]
MAASTSASTATLIASTEQLKAFLSSIQPFTTLYLDLEGNNLCRHGAISLITILPHLRGAVRVIDVLALGRSAFTTTSQEGKSLKSVFEDPAIPKCLWDTRNDADALWAHHQVRLAGVVDIQLLENASRSGSKKYLCGLEKAIKLDLNLGAAELNSWLRCKEDTKRLMPTKIFDVRPMAPGTLNYCVNDVVLLPDLHAFYLQRIKGDWLSKAKEESLRRVDEACSPAYEPQGPTKALGPWGEGGGAKKMSYDEFLDRLEDEMMERQAEEMMRDLDDDWCEDD